METIADYAPLVAALKGARHVGVLTGAGVSTLSGIPDFRGPKGLYANPDAERIFDIDWFDRDPRIYYKGAAVASSSTDSRSTRRIPSIRRSRVSSGAAS